MKWAEVTPARVEHIIRFLRYQDRAEVMFSHGWDSRQAVLESIAGSAIVRCICDDEGQAVGICGVANETVIWLLATDGLLGCANHRRQFIRGAKRWIDGLLTSGHHDVLENWVLASNVKTLRWLKSLGFSIDTPVPVGRSCQLFCHVWREA